MIEFMFISIFKPISFLLIIISTYSGSGKFSKNFGLVM